MKQTKGLCIILFSVLQNIVLLLIREGTYNQLGLLAAFWDPASHCQQLTTIGSYQQERPT